MRRRHTLALLALVAILISAPAAAYAHTPVLEQSGRSDAPWAAPQGYGPARLFPGAQDIPDPIVSRAVYGTLSPGESFDAYRFVTSATATVTIPVEILVPDTPANAGFRPTLVIVGYGDVASADGLPTAIREHLSRVQAPVPLLVLPDPGSDPRPSEYEPFVGETLLNGGSGAAELGGTGTYYVLVYDPMGRTGDYRLALGKAEAFTAAEALRTPLEVLRIKLGLYGQHSFEWGFAALLAVVAAAVAGVAGWLIARRRRRRNRRPARSSEDATIRED